MLISRVHDAESTIRERRICVSCVPTVARGGSYYEFGVSGTYVKCFPV